MSTLNTAAQALIDLGHEAIHDDKVDAVNEATLFIAKDLSRANDGDDDALQRLKAYGNQSAASPSSPTGALPAPTDPSDTTLATASRQQLFDALGATMSDKERYQLESAMKMEFDSKGVPREVSTLRQEKKTLEDKNRDLEDKLAKAEKTVSGDLAQVKAERDQFKKNLEDAEKKLKAASPDLFGEAMTHLDNCVASADENGTPWRRKDVYLVNTNKVDSARDFIDDQLAKGNIEKK